MRITFQQGLGKYNANYHTALIWWEAADRHVFHRSTKQRSNWMPKHDEIERILEALLHVEGPEKREHLAKLWRDAIDRGLAKPADYNQ